MLVLKLLRTTAFKLALVYLVIFAISAFALLGFIYVTTQNETAKLTDEAISAEVLGLAEQYRRRGLQGLRQIIIERGAKAEQSIYLLANANHTRIAGNLSVFPTNRAVDKGWVNFKYMRQTLEGEEQLRPARAQTFLLPGNFWLIVGRDVLLRERLQEQIVIALVWAGILTVGLGLTGGYFISRNMLRRLDGINRASRDIMEGDFSRRVPISRSGDELDELATSLNRMLDQIERLMISMRDVANNIAHDLRTPLNRLRSRLELALLQPPDANEYAESLESALKDADALITTFNALLLIAETESGAVRENMETVDLITVARDAVELYDPVAETHSMRLAVTAEPGAFVRGNKSLIAQALANLIDNAIKYSPDGGAIQVRVRPGAAGAELSVADSGPGIPEEDRERVLQRFVRLDSSRNAPGTGLGLSLVAAVARMHNATLELGDAKPGLRITLRFPLVHPLLVLPAPALPMSRRAAL